MATVPEGNFAGWLAGRLGRHSCLIDAATGLTIEPAEVPGLIAGYGAVFRGAGLQAGERILVAGSLSPLSCLAYLGAMYAGLVVVPVEERSLAASGASLVEATGARAIWTEQKPSFDWLRQAPVLCLHGELTGGKPQPLAPVARKDADVAALMATSGSTGVPRFVMVTHGNLRANTEAIVRSQGLLEDERAMLVLPLSYCFGASVLHTHLAQGGGVVFDRRFMFPDKVLQAIAQYRCTTFAGVPTAYNVLLQRSKIRSMALPESAAAAAGGRRPGEAGDRGNSPRRSQRSALCDVRPNRSHRPDFLSGAVAPGRKGRQRWPAPGQPGGSHCERARRGTAAGADWRDPGQRPLGLRGLPE